MGAYLSLIHRLVKEGIVKTPSIIEAFLHVHRKYFMPDHLEEEAGIDTALPIGKGQTISQPRTVAFMLELLEPQKGNKVMDIGSGSGWTSALLASIVGSGGKVFALEIVPELYTQALINIAQVPGIPQIIVPLCQDAGPGLPQEAPFDRILCSASLKKIPDAWIAQLGRNGRLVAPIQQSVWLFYKKNATIIKKEFPGFLFVPFV